MGEMYGAREARAHNARLDWMLPLPLSYADHYTLPPPPPNTMRRLDWTPSLGAPISPLHLPYISPISPL